VGSVGWSPLSRCRLLRVAYRSRVQFGRMLAFIESRMYRHQGKEWADGCKRMVVESKVE